MHPVNRRLHSSSIDNPGQKPKPEHGKGDTTATMSLVAPSVPQNVHWKEFFCGGGAALCNTIITYPLNKIIFRQMIHGHKSKFAFSQLHKEGIWYLYRGVLPPLLQRTLSMSLMFGVYDETLQPLLKYEVNPYVAKTIAGLIAGTVEATLMPFERIQTLLIHPKYHRELKNTLHAAIHIGKYYGFAEYYRGLIPILLRNGPSNSMFFIIRDEIKIRLPHQENPLYHTGQNFLAGASIGAFLSTLYYPISVIKISMQSELGGPNRGVVFYFKKILHERDSKFIYIYRGVPLNISRAFISWGIINSCYEIFRKLLYGCG